jgi:hypothetical protein
MQYVLRVSLPDRPGSLHALTGACSEAAANIQSLDVIEQADGFAVDDLCLTIADPDALTVAIDRLPGTAVMSLRRVTASRDVDGAIALAAALVAEGRGAVRLLVDRLPYALWAGSALAVGRGWNGLEVLAASAGALVPECGGWLPLVGPRRLQRHDLIGDGPSSAFDGLELAAAPLGQTTSAVIVARTGGPRFVDRELRQLDLLAKVAVATEVAHTHRRPVERIEPARRTAVRS